MCLPDRDFLDLWPGLCVTYVRYLHVHHTVSSPLQTLPISHPPVHTSPPASTTVTYMGCSLWLFTSTVLTEIYLGGVPSARHAATPRGHTRSWGPAVYGNVCYYERDVHTYVAGRKIHPSVIGKSTSTRRSNSSSSGTILKRQGFYSTTARTDGKLVHRRRMYAEVPGRQPGSFVHSPNPSTFSGHLWHSLCDRPRSVSR